MTSVNFQQLRTLFFFLLLSAAWASSQTSDDYGSFLRAFETREQRINRELQKAFPEDYGCLIGCHDNTDCHDSLICYKRKAGEQLPTCCTSPSFQPSGLSEDMPDNFCVSAGCAGNTNDPANPDPLLQVDDDYFNGGPFPKLKQCHICTDTYQCQDGLVCYAREKNDPIPDQDDCCPELSSKDRKSDTNWCVQPECRAPTPAPAPVDLGSALGPLCFSGDTTVTVLHKGTIRMTELQVGDRVWTGTTTANQQYQPVYAFAHLDKTQSARFLQIYTNLPSESTPLEITSDHLVFVQGKGPVKADSIQIGDLLHGSSSDAAQVTDIRSVVRTGLYAPLTPSGTILVSGILASNYIALQSHHDEAYVELPAPIGVLPWWTQHDLVHWWLAPLRLVCGAGIYCDKHDQEGKLYSVDWGLRLAAFMQEQSLVAQVLVLIPILILLAVPVATEKVLMGAQSRPAWVTMLVLGPGVICIFWSETRQGNHKAKLA